ncbi:helix-turn-helix domain-containing protein [Streptomyces melanogenes]|uniref:helix-turn-helix domain-containing protein n=1 Tax=Streptomyces melanogenes TaxID=67326 RepID=UPI00379147FB
MRAVELFEQRRPCAEVARMVGIHPESVGRWKRLGEQGGSQALRRQPATSRPPKLDDTQVELARAALEQDAQAHGFGANLWILQRAGMAAALGYHATDPGRGPRLCFPLKGSRTARVRRPTHAGASLLTREQGAERAEVEPLRPSPE